MSFLSPKNSKKVSLQEATSGLLLYESPKPAGTAFVFSIKPTARRISSHIVLATFLPLGDILFLVTSSGIVLAVDLTDCRRLKKLVKLPAPCTALQSYRNTTGDVLLLACTIDFFIQVIKYETGSIVQILKAHESNVRSMSIREPAQDLMISVSADEVFLWDLHNLRKLRQLRSGDDAKIHTAFFMPPEGKQILSCLKDGHVFVWDVDTFECTYHLSVGPKLTPLEYQCLCVSADGSLLFAGGHSPCVHVWNLGSGAAAKAPVVRDICEVVKLPVGNVLQMEWVPVEGGSLAILGSDGRVRLVHRSATPRISHRASGTKSGTVRGTCPSPWNEIYSVGLGTREDPLVLSFACGVASSHLATIASDGGLSFFDFQRLSKPRTSSPPTYVVTSKTNPSPHENKAFCCKSLRPDPKKPTDNNEDERRPLTPSLAWSEASGKGPQNPETAHLDPNPSPPPPLDIQKKRVDGPATPRSTVANKELRKLLEPRKLRLMLNEYQNFPPQHRSYLWRSLLHLSGNVKLFKQLTDKGIHSNFLGVCDQLPSCDRHLQSDVLRICSALVHSNRKFAFISRLPSVVLPFVRLFRHDHLCYAFEAVLKIVDERYVFLFDSYPMPPERALSTAANLLAYYDHGLFRHFLTTGLTPEIYIWPTLSFLFAGVLEEDDWFTLWDNALVQTPSFLLTFSVAYVVACRGGCLRLASPDSVRVSSACVVNVRKI
uniref:TBC1 domain family member 31 n=2 Tax=Mesocestoides corti TaxID=53468 RepID=A0A5K3EMG0_MESCO